MPNFINHSSPMRMGHSSKSVHVMEPEQQTVDREAETADSLDEVGTVPRDDQTAARPHLLTLLYPPDTPSAFTDKFPPQRVRKATGQTIQMGRGQNVDVLLNDAHMPRIFVEVSCRVADPEAGPQWVIRNKSNKKPVRIVWKDATATKTSLKHDDEKELKDGCELKLETLKFFVRTEEGDMGDLMEFELEIIPMEAHHHHHHHHHDVGGGTPSSFLARHLSSSDSAPSLTSAAGLSRQRTGSGHGGSQHIVGGGGAGGGMVLPMTGGTHVAVGLPLQILPHQQGVYAVPSSPLAACQHCQHSASLAGGASSPFQLPAQAGLMGQQCHHSPQAVYAVRQDQLQQQLHNQHLQHNPQGPQAQAVMSGAAGNHSPYMQTHAMGGPLLSSGQHFHGGGGGVPPQQGLPPHTVPHPSMQPPHQHPHPQFSHQQVYPHGHYPSGSQVFNNQQQALPGGPQVLNYQQQASAGVPQVMNQQQTLPGGPLAFNNQQQSFAGGPQLFNQQQPLAGGPQVLNQQQTLAGGSQVFNNQQQALHDSPQAMRHHQALPGGSQMLNNQAFNNTLHQPRNQQPIPAAGPSLPPGIPEAQQHSLAAAPSYAANNIPYAMAELQGTSLQPFSSATALPVNGLLPQYPPSYGPGPQGGQQGGPGPVPTGPQHEAMPPQGGPHNGMLPLRGPQSMAAVSNGGQLNPSSSHSARLPQQQQPQPYVTQPESAGALNLGTTTHHAADQTPMPQPRFPAATVISNNAEQMQQQRFPTIISNPTTQDSNPQLYRDSSSSNAAAGAAGGLPCAPPITQLDSLKIGYPVQVTLASPTEASGGGMMSPVTSLPHSGHGGFSAAGWNPAGNGGGGGVAASTSSPHHPTAPSAGSNTTAASRSHPSVGRSEPGLGPLLLHQQAYSGRAAGSADVTFNGSSGDGSGAPLQAALASVGREMTMTSAGGGGSVPSLHPSYSVNPAGSEMTSGGGGGGASVAPLRPPPFPLSSLTTPGPNGNSVRLRSHETVIAAATSPTSLGSSVSSLPVLDLRALQPPQGEASLAAGQDQVDATPGRGQGQTSVVTQVQWASAQAAASQPPQGNAPLATGQDQVNMTQAGGQGQIGVTQAMGQGQVDVTQARDQGQVGVTRARGQGPVDFSGQEGQGRQAEENDERQPQEHDDHS